jgi:excisionase family DNA binding protein
MASERRGAVPGVLLSPDEVAGQLGVPVATLANWRSGGVGPVYLRVGRHVRYRPADLEAWLDGLVVHPRNVTGAR